jgi:hypothetical protein
MGLDGPQQVILKTDITVTRAAVVYEGQTLLEWWNAGDDQKLADFYNQPASPVVKLWRPTVPVTRLNESIVGAEFIALTLAKQNLWMVITQDASNATLPRTRQNFIDVFGGASTTMGNLTAVAQKDATYGEALYSAPGGPPGSGNVSEIFGESITGTDVGQSRSA